MKRIALIALMTSSVIFGTFVEEFFDGMFKVYYNKSLYSLNWLYGYVSELRSRYGLETDMGFVRRVKLAIDKASAATGIDPLLIVAVISVETGFRNVMGSVGELGMMQIKPATAEFVQRLYSLPKPREGWKALLWDYDLNILYGAHYLKYLLEKFRDLRKAVEYYNAGSQKEVYADRIFKLYRELIEEGEGVGG